jgi:predicted transcriptional regulator
MKTKELIIGIKSVEQGLKEFSTTLKSLGAGKPVKPKGEKLNFVSLEAARTFFTPKRIELLKLIHHKEPNSVYELAKMAGRDLKNVQQDVGILARVGLIDLEQEKRGRERTTPKVDYDHLEVRFQIAV